MRYLITGGCGFLGSNLSAEVLRRGGELTVMDNLRREGADANRRWLEAAGSFCFIHDDVADDAAMAAAVKTARPDVVFHLAGQVAMTTSIENPALDFRTNAMGSFNLLEAVRKHSPGSVVIYSSTNKVYGDLASYRCVEKQTRYEVEGRPRGFDESTPLDFQSPYGCSKGAADQYMLDYARIHGLRTIVFRHSTVFGTRQFSTFDQGWVGWFIRQALLQKEQAGASPFTIAGDGKQVRDILFISDLIACYFAAVEGARQAAGQAFNIGGGMDNSMSLLELFGFLEEELGMKLKYERQPWRISDQKVFVADCAKARKLIGWAPRLAKTDGLRRMIQWTRDNGH